MKRDLQNTMDRTGYSLDMVTAEVKGMYPKFDRYLMSKVVHGTRYGIRLRSDAEKAVYTAMLGEASESRRSDGHLKTGRVSCRLTSEQKEALQTAFRADGYETMQDGIAWLIEKYMKEHEA